MTEPDQPQQQAAWDVPRRTLPWVDLITINAYWVGINVATGTITPVLLPYLVALFAPAELKNTYLSYIRVIGLAVAMAVQPIAGMVSDRSTHRLGRRRPFIIRGALGNILFLALVGLSPFFVGSALDGFFEPRLGVSTAYVVLLLGIVLLQISSNVGHGALQGLIPDLVPDNQRGRASGVKAVMELAPSFLIIAMGPLVDAGKIWTTVAIIMAGFVLTMLVTVLGVREQPLAVRPTDPLAPKVLRILGLTIIFVLVTQGAIWLVRYSGTLLARRQAAVNLQLTVVGLIGLACMAGAILIGVYWGASVGIGREARQQRSFIWWVVNRLLFLAGVGSIQSFAQYYLGDVLNIENAATMTTYLLAVVAIFLIITAISGGYLADRFGRKRLVAWSGLVAAAGTLFILLAKGIAMVLLGGCVIGTAAGTFMATNWALGTDLAPSGESGRYLGISNLAGAGAGIVGTGIGGPLADFFNALRPGLGYLVIFALYTGLFLLSTAALSQVKEPDLRVGPASPTA